MWKSKGVLLSAVICAGLVFTPVARGAAPPQPSLFGVPLAHATRPELERALRAAHLILPPGGSHPWYDAYQVNGAVKNAKVLAISFTKRGRFAKAMYVFPSFISTKHTLQVMAMVRAKYGAPTDQYGHLRIGRLRVVWKLPHAFRILVTRRWPNPTTFMIIENQKMVARMKKEQKTALAHSGAL